MRREHTAPGRGGNIWFGLEVFNLVRGSPGTKRESACLAYGRDKASRESKSRTPRHLSSHALRQPAPAGGLPQPRAVQEISPSGRSSAAAAAAGDAPADKRWGDSAPSSGKNPAASLAPGFPEERDRQRRGSQPLSAGISHRVPLDAHLRQMGTERAGYCPQCPGRAGGGRDGWSPRCGSRHGRRGAGAPIDGTAANCVTTAWGRGWRAERRLLTTLVQGAGGKTQQIRSFKKTGSRSEGGGADCDGGCSRWP